MNRKFYLILVLVCVALLHPVASFADGTAVTGTVTDDNEEPLAGVAVTIDGKKTYSLTDTDGHYSINALTGDVLVFEYLGMHTQKIKVGSSKIIDVKMIPDAIGLDEVVVVGYGIQNKRDITTSISSVSVDKLEEMPINDINQALIGQAAGVNVTSASGSPGGGFDIQIRGMSTLGADSSPLYVVDGVVLPQETNLESGAFSFINPADVASIEILKDAAAAAIYGSRASNGVVLITTKQGTVGKPNIGITIKAGVQQVFNKVDLLDAREFAELAIEARNNLWLDLGVDINDPDPVRGVNTKIGYFQDFLASGKKGTDWQDAIYQLAPNQEYQINVSGGSKSVKYMISSGFLDQEGIVRNSDFQRFSFRSNIDANLGRKVTLGVKLNPVFTVQNYIRTHGRYHDAAAGVVQGALLMNPMLDIYDPDSISGYTQGINQGNAMVNVENPVAKVNLLKDKRNTLRLLGEVYLNYNIIKGLNFRTSASTNINYFQKNSITPSTIGGYTQQPPRDNAIESASSMTMIVQTSTQMSYNKNIKGHNISAVAVFETQYMKNNGVTAKANGTWTDQLLIVDGSLDESYRLGSSSINEWGLLSAVARINYNYRNRYYVTASTRMDGSSRFSKKWGTFPAVSAAWRISNEKFMRNASWISDLKLRASFGVTGNNSIGNYQHLSLMTGSNYVFGSGGEHIENGVRISTSGNDELTWEKTRQIDVGFDISLFRDRVNIIADYYDKRTEDLLLSLQTPLISGFSSIMTNIGKIRNHGWEVTLNTRNIDQKFKWDTDFNISFNRQKVQELGPKADPLYGSALFFNNTNITQIGYPVGLFYGLNVVGIYQNQWEVDNFPGIKTGNAQSRPGEFIFEDVNKDGSITMDDRTIIGDPHPDFTFGFTNTFSFWNFTLKVFLRGAVGFDVMNMSFGDTMYNMGANMHRNVLNRWQSEENPGDGKTPRVVRVNRAVVGNSQLNSSFIEDGSFVNIQNVSLTYRFPTSITKKLKMNRLSLAFSVNNLYMFTDYTGYNPEAAWSIGSTLSPGVDWGTYPLARTYMFTLTTNF